MRGKEWQKKNANKECKKQYHRRKPHRMLP